jgi:hypothetical protein
MRPSTLDPTSPPKRAPTLTRALGSEPRPALEVGSDIDTCPMTVRGSRTVEIKKDLAVTACNKTHMFPRHVCTLLRRLQDVRVDDMYVAEVSAPQQPSRCTCCTVDDRAVVSRHRPAHHRSHQHNALRRATGEPPWWGASAVSGTLVLTGNTARIVDNTRIKSRYD